MNVDYTWLKRKEPKARLMRMEWVSNSFARLLGLLGVLTVSQDCKTDSLSVLGLIEMPYLLKLAG